MAKQIKQSEQPAQRKAFAVEGYNLDDQTVKPLSRPTVKANDPHFLAVHPDRWIVRFDRAKNPRLMPNYGVLPYKVGVEGCTAGATKFKPAVATWESRGWTYLPHSLGYTAHFANADGQTHYMTTFDKVFAGSSAVVTDIGAMADWFDSLIAQRVIEAPTIPVVERLLALWSERAAKAAENAHSSVKAKADLTQLQKAVDLLDVRLQEMYAAMDPAELDFGIKPVELE